MPRKRTFKVTVAETVVQHRTKVFRAYSKAGARTQAYADDWNSDDWVHGRDITETDIEDIEEIKAR